MDDMCQYGAGISLLYVEDDPGIRDVVVRLLAIEYPCMKIRVAANGLEGLEAFREERTDIILTDIGMPVMDGIRMAEAIMSLDPHAHIIVVTAHSDTHYLLDAINVGIRRYVLKPIEKDRVVEAINDCIGRITLEQQVRKQDEYIRKLSRVVEQSPSMVLITDAEGTVEYVNPKFVELTGHAFDEVRGQTPRILKKVAKSPDVDESIWKTIVAGREWRGEFLNRKKNGELYWEAATISPLFDEKGNISHYVGVSEDITARKKAEKELKNLRIFSASQEMTLERERGRIAREIHDDIGQLLTALQFDIAWLSGKIPHNEAGLREKAGAMAEMVNTAIKTVQSISTGLRPKLLDDLGLSSAIEWQAQQFEERTGIACRLDIDMDGICVSQELTTALFRIFQESLTNIMRHAEAALVEVSLRRRWRRLVLEIADNGRGIGRNALSDPRSVGLIGMRERAHQAGGKVSIHGIKGKGTRVRAEFPLAGGYCVSDSCGGRG